MRLAAFFAEREGMPFRWGTNDCALFAADAALAMTDVDLAKKYRGRYDSALSAKRLVPNLGALLDSYASSGMLRSIELPFVWRGDVVLFAGAYGQTLAIALGRYIASPGIDGMLVQPVAVGQRAWRI